VTQTIIIYNKTKHCIVQSTHKQRPSAAET